jgi:hypothetical protein
MLIAMFINSMLAQKTSRSKHWPWIDCHGAGVAHWKAVANVDALRNPLVGSVPVYEVFLLTQTRGSSTPLSPAAVANVSDLAPASTQTQHPLHLPEISSQGRESKKHIVSSSMLVDLPQGRAYPCLPFHISRRPCHSVSLHAFQVLPLPVERPSRYMLRILTSQG